MTKPVLSEKEILALVKNVIPADMRGDSELCMLQGFYMGHREGVKLERQAFLDVLAKFMRGEME